MDHLRCSFLLIHHPREPFLRQEWIVVWSLFRRENGKLGISLRVPPPGNKAALLRVFNHSFSLTNPLIRPCFRQVALRGYPSIHMKTRHVCFTSQHVNTCTVAPDDSGSLVGFVFVFLFTPGRWMYDRCKLKEAYLPREKKSL